jgi:DNA segregation ATPase FtsK/SpoIIIE, S-DNA-T family
MPPDDTRPGCWPTLARWCWRHRAELAPAWLALAVLALGVAIRLVTFDRPAFWPLVILNLAAIAAAGGLWQWGERVRLDRAVERAYAAGLALAAGLWLALGAVLSPMQPTLLLALLVGTVAGGAPWWWHRRIRSRVEAGVAAWRADLEQHEQGSSVGRPRFDQAGGVTIPWSLAPGRIIEDIRPAVRRLESLLGLRPGAIEVDQDPDSARDVVLRIQPHDPHRQALDYPGPPPDATITRPVTIGRYLDGGPAETPLLGLHALIAGATGAGKSNVLNVVIAYLAACPDVVLWGCDLKHGLELGPWEGVFARIATTPDQAAELLEALVRVQQARGEDMARRKIRNWPTSPDEPALICVIDEHKALAGSKRAIAAIETLTGQGRAMAASTVDSTQYPINDALGSPLIAPQMTVKVCLRVNTPGEANVILGPGSAGAGWVAHKISKGKPGTFYLDAPGAETPRLARAYHVTDEMVASVVRTYAGRRPQLDEVSERAVLGPPTGSAGGTADSPHARHADGTPHGPLGGPRVGTADDPGGGTATTPLDDTADGSPPQGVDGTADSTSLSSAEALEALLAVLATVGERGIRAEDLVTAIGRGRTWTYDRLGELERQGRARRGLDRRWRLAPNEGGWRTP